MTKKGRKKWHRVVAHYLDGRLLKGTTSDFNAEKETLHIIDASENEHLISVGELKALFFVRQLDGDPGYKERKGFHRKRRKSFKVMVEFADGELLFGFTYVSYRHDSPGFFMFPGDPNSNNLKMFVVRNATKRVKVRDLQTQKEEVYC